MRITHGRVSLELHELHPQRHANPGGPALLLLHALFGSSADWGEAPATWPGPVYALDFCGHGRSDHLLGGGYYPELLAADADAALARVGRAAIAGMGLGAYVALLVAGARRDLVPTALLLPGAGLSGVGPAPRFDGPRLSPDGSLEGEPAAGSFDPAVRILDRDVRPVDYVEPFAHAARCLLLLEDEQPRPPWWEAIRQIPTAEPVPDDLGIALARLAENAQRGLRAQPNPCSRTHS